jgi:hypothetical protein
MRLNHLITACAIIGAFSALAGPATHRWTVETSKPAATVCDAFQGETIYLEPTLLSYGSAASVTNSTLTLFWQTNGMGSAWWSKPADADHSVTGRIRAIFAPTNDIGAAQYTFFIQATDTSASNYRAYGLIRMRTSPGYAPTAAPAPGYQWVSPADMQAAIDAATNPIPGQTAAAITAATNGLVTKTVTNGLATSVSVVASTNPIPTWINAATNPIPSWIAAAVGLPRYQYSHSPTQYVGPNEAYFACYSSTTQQVFIPLSVGIGQSFFISGIYTNGWIIKPDNTNSVMVDDLSSTNYISVTGNHPSSIFVCASNVYYAINHWGSYKEAQNYITGSGGDATNFYGDWAAHVYLKSGTFRSTTPGTAYLFLVAGGGAGASGAGGGGGAGGYVYGVTNIAANRDYNVIVGGGGKGNASGLNNVGGNGTNSSFGGFVAVGGGGGGSWQSAQSAQSGGSGGGGGGWSVSQTTAGDGTVGQGYGGGNNAGRIAAPFPSGGGGGGGGQGQSASAASVSGNGGVGISSTCATGTTNLYCGGGGGGTYSFGTAGTASHGGGAGGVNDQTSTAGTAGTGGGSGGAGAVGTSANGGSGVVVIYYKVRGGYE